MPKTKAKTVGDLRELIKGLPGTAKLVACWPRGRMAHRYDPEVELSDVRVAEFSDTKRKYLAVVVKLVPYET
jgi:hypothetical protein